jgi:sugar O-acyltransferase (sialic acid O-acetyltransferase NeuD family)
MTVKTLAILGAGGHGKVVADTARAAGWESIIFFDDAWPMIQQVGRWKIVGTSEHLMQSSFDTVAVAIGDNATRLKKTTQLRNAAFHIPTLIHPSAIISEDASIGSGNVIFAGVVINPSSIIKDDCIINTHATIEHDCILHNGVHISPGATLGGGVCVGQFSWIGLGANVRQQIIIGEHVTVGAGALILKNIPDHCVAFGVPAKIHPSKSLVSN